VGPGGDVRMVDYKSGKDDPSVLMTGAADASDVADTIFAGSYDKRKKVKAGLQFFIYDKMLHEKGIADMKHVSNSMYATAGLFTAPAQICPLDPVFADELDMRLERLISEIRNPEVPFTMAEDVRNCEWCDFRMICGR